MSQAELDNPDDLKGPAFGTDRHLSRSSERRRELLNRGRLDRMLRAPGPLIG
jgi:hypothetical protein